MGRNKGFGPESTGAGQEGTMASSTMLLRSRPEHLDDGLAEDLAALMRALRDLVDPYRPEQHYMRGPGPKWHAKHDTAGADALRSPAAGSH